MVHFDVDLRQIYTSYRQDVLVGWLLSNKIDHQQQDRRETRVTKRHNRSSEIQKPRCAHTDYKWMLFWGFDRNLHVTSHYEINTTRLAGRRWVEQAIAKVSCSKTFFLVILCTQTVFSMLVFMCRDPGDTTSKVSCCVESYYWFKNRHIDVIANLCLFRHNYAFTWRFDSYIHKKKPRLHFGESFTLILKYIFNDKPISEKFIMIHNCASESHLFSGVSLMLNGGWGGEKESNILNPQSL